MELGLCPYCQLYGLVTALKLTSGGFVASGRCTACGYACDSGPAAGADPRDLPAELPVPAGPSVRD